MTQPDMEAFDAHGDDAVKILIVDDEPKNLAVLEAVLVDPGYRLVRATSGQDALLALMNDEFAVLVLDVRMPGMTGFEVAQLVKERKKTARIPIIFLTAYYNEDQHILEGYGSGAVDYLHKPVNPMVLRSKVAVFAELHRKSRALEAANRRLVSEITERRAAEARLSELNESLDRRVTERTLELQKSEAQLRAEHQRKDEFLATLAHELRNPLAPVRNAAQLLARHEVDSAQLRWAVEVIERQIRAMSRLIDDLMDISRINQGRIEIQREAIAIADVLSDAVEAARPLIEESQHALSVNAPHEGLHVEGDRTRLAQALINVLNNAAKYTDAGGRIEVHAAREAGDVAITVIDSGVGIPRERLTEVFEMFSQVDPNEERSRGGLGIGLSLARRLIEMHGGSVHAESEGPGKGSKFHVRLPLAERRDPRPAERPLPDMAPSNRLRILAADDNVDAVESLAALLTQLGHEVLVAHDGDAVLDAVEGFDPQVMLLDIGMPKRSGHEVCRILRARPGGAARTMVAISGWGQPDDLKSSKQAGFDVHLVKPVDFDALISAIGAGRRAALSV